MLRGDSWLICGLFLIFLSFNVSMFACVCCLGCLVGRCLFCDFLVVSDMCVASVVGICDDGSAIFWLVSNVFFTIGDRLLQRLMLSKDQDPVDMLKTAIALINNLGGAVVGGLKSGTRRPRWRAQKKDGARMMMQRMEKR